MSRRRTNPTSGTWSPSPSPPPSPPLTLSDADRLRLLASHGGLKPSSLPHGAKSPLLFLNPEQLTALAEKQEAEEEEEEEEEVALWEELLNDALWTIPFAFLFSGMDYAVHAQFGQDLLPSDEFHRLLNAIPTIYLLTFLTSRPRPLLRPLFLQLLLLAASLLAGISLIHMTTTESYLKVMRQAPGLGVLWVWTIVRMDLEWAVAGLLGVAGAVWMRGEIGGVIWW